MAEPGESAGETSTTPLDEKLLQEIYHSVGNAVLIYDADTGGIIDVNDAMCEMYGYTRAEARGLSIEELGSGTPPYTQSDAVEKVHKAAAGEPQTFDWQAKHRDGTLFWVEVSMRPVTVDEERFVLVIVREVSHRKEREQKLEALNHAAGELMTAETRIDVAEIGVEAARDILGLEASAIHGFEEAAGGLVPIAATEALRDLVGEPPVLTADDSIAWQVYEAGEARAIDDVREESDVHNPATDVRSELYLPLDGHGILIAGSDTPSAFDQEIVTIGKLLAATVASAFDQVEREQQLRSREAELTRQNEQLEAFTRVASHDLRNPLNAAQGYLELARETDDNPDLERTAQALERMSTLIDDLLRLAREGEQVGEVEPVDLGEVTETSWRNIDAPRATLVIDTDRTIRADRCRLQQLLENLMRNAIDHGGEDVTVQVGALENGFSVEDDGPGISSADREAVFEAGYSTSHEGTGFGLSIVNQIVQAHGWRIRVTDGADGGACFEITGVEVLEE